MRGALTYILLTKFKNQLKAILKSPVKLIYFIIIIALIGFTIFAGKLDDEPGRKLRDINELFCIVLGLYTLMFIMLSLKGFSNGASMFSMADVNLIFTGPYKPHKVLVYGLFQQLGTSLLLGLFILFQYTTIHTSYGAGIGDLLIIFAGYALTVFLSQFTAMVIYSFTSSSEGRKRLVKITYYAILLCFGLYAVSGLLKKGPSLVSLTTVLSDPVFSFLPVAGWMSSVVAGALSGNIMQLLLGLCAGAVYVALLICFVVIYNTDYYEDVLQSTEVSFSAITAKKEGRLGEAAPANVKVGKIGIGKGYGAEAIYYKHLVENRRSRFFIMDKTTFIFSLMTIIVSFFMKNIGIIAVFGFSVYMQIFSISLGRFVKELLKPYIYLIPESPVRKMIYSIMESLPKFALTAALIFIPVSFIVDLSPSDTIMVILAHMSFSILFTAGNVVIERIWSGGSSVALALLLYVFVLFVLALPGLVLAILMFIFGSDIPLLSLITQNGRVMLSLLVCNIPIALLALFLCRNMLQYAELNGKA